MDVQFDLAVPSGVVTMVEAFFTSMRLQEGLDEMLQCDEEQCKLTLGQRLLGLMLCVCGGREALYRVEEFYESHNLERLFGPDVAAGDVNDDALGRALDKLKAALEVCERLAKVEDHGSQQVYSPFLWHCGLSCHIAGRLDPGAPGPVSGRRDVEMKAAREQPLLGNPVHL